jgi:hypothetical protein
MNMKYDLKSFGQDIVYVKPVLTADLPAEVRAEIGDLREVFAVHNTKGEQLALVADRSMAFHLAHENDMNPVTVH